jgi:hypothetical protein
MKVFVYIKASSENVLRCNVVVIVKFSKQKRSIPYIPLRIMIPNHFSDAT